MFLTVTESEERSTEADSTPMDTAQAGEVDTSLPSRKFALLVSSVLTLVVALVTAGATLAGTYLGAQSAHDTALAEQHATQTAELEDAARSKRSDVYFDLLDAIREVVIVPNYTFRPNISDNDLPPRDDVVGRIRDSNIKAWIAGTDRVHKLLDQVYVFSSDEAWHEVESMLKSLPAIQISPDKQPNLNKPWAYNPNGFILAYDHFRAVVCREVAARPRNGCR